MWLQVARSNNNPEVPAKNFLECVTEYGGCPVKVRSDCGTENGVLAAIQCEFRGTADAHVFGSSPSKQRIRRVVVVLQKESFYLADQLLQRFD